MSLFQIECYLGKWDDIISLLISCLATLANVILTVCIFLLGQRVAQDRDRQCFLSVIDEVGTQYEILKRLSRGFSDIQSKASSMIDKRDIQKFLMYLYQIKKMYATNWISLPLHKFDTYQGLFDQYRSKRIRICSHSKKIPIPELYRLIRETQEIFKNCINQQNTIQQLIPNLNKFFQSKEFAEQIMNEIGSSNTMESFCQSIFEYQEGKQNIIDWDETSTVAKSLEPPVQKYQKCCEEIREKIQEFCEKYNISRYYFHLEELQSERKCQSRKVL